jgi:plastocyanin
MNTRNIGENFNVVLSTKKTLFGASSADFSVYYADVNALGTKVAVAGGATEAVVAIATGSEHIATTTAPASVGDRVLQIDPATSTIVAGDTVQYATGLYAYVQSVVSGVAYLKTPLRAGVASGATITQVGNTGEYATGTISIPTVGEYLVAIESSIHGILVEQRVKVVDNTTTVAIDPNAPVTTVAVAY